MGEPDAFDDLASLRVEQDFTGSEAKKLITTVPVRRPGRQSWFRVHPDPNYRLEGAAILTLRDEGETFLVGAGMADEVPGEYLLSTIFTVVSRQGVVSLWPVTTPGANGRANSWHLSAVDAAERAMSTWVRMASDRELGAYVVAIPQARFPEPEWPELPFSELLRLAFRDHLIDRADHPVVQRLRGLR